jgi:CRISPR/Cas system-associated exonuclease Cas4 (RecB family)
LGNYRAILLALHSVTNAPLTVAEKDREYVPRDITTTVTKVAESQNEAQSSAKSDAAGVGSIVVTSTPDAAKVYVDGAFLGNATATFKLPAGKHSIKVTLAGDKDWTNDLTVLAGSELKLNAALEKWN